MIVLHDEETLLHDTVELLGAKLISAIESPARIKAIVQAIQDSRHHDLRTIKASQEDKDVTLELARATHEGDYLEHIQSVHGQWLAAGLVESHESVLPECFRLHNVARTELRPPKDIYARAGYYAFDMSTGVTEHSWKSVIVSANLTVQAAKLLLDSEARTTQTPKSVLALCRPPGHHCTGSQAGGYCYINNVALSVTTLRHFSPPATRTRRTSNPHFSSTSLLKFAILDIDFHHGNGTQSQFYNDPNVFYVSIHGEDEFPYYTGAADERGPQDHPAFGTNLNLPLATGSSFQQYQDKLRIALDAISVFAPDYLLVSLGFDTFHLDPLGKFAVETGDYEIMGRSVRDALKMPAVIVLEGGYVIDRLGPNLLSFLSGWESAESKS